MPELDALHADAHRVNDFVAGHLVTSVSLNRLPYELPGCECWATFQVAARSRGKKPPSPPSGS